MCDICDINVLMLEQLTLMQNVFVAYGRFLSSYFFLLICFNLFVLIWYFTLFYIHLFYPNDAQDSGERMIFVFSADPIYRSLKTVVKAYGGHPLTAVTNAHCNFRTDEFWDIGRDLLKLTHSENFIKWNTWMSAFL